MDLRFTPDELAFPRRGRELLSRSTAGRHSPQDGARPAPIQGRHRHLAAHPERQGLGRAALAGRVGRHRLDAGKSYIFKEEINWLPRPIRCPSTSTWSGRCWSRSATRSRSAASCRASPISTSGSAKASPSPARAPISHRCKTAARLEGDHYVVNGQKIWTSRAHNADWMFCLVRTDASAKQQRGISLSADRHEDAGPHGAADPHHRRRAPLQRSVLRRRARAGREPASVKRTRAGPMRSTCSATSASASLASAPRSTASSAPSNWPKRS